MTGEVRLALGARCLRVAGQFRLAVHVLRQTESAMSDKTHDRGRSDQLAAPSTTEASEAHKQRKEDRAKFARAMTRMEFGRHYWDDQMARDLQATLIRRRKERE